MICQFRISYSILKLDLQLVFLIFNQALFVGKYLNFPWFPVSFLVDRNMLEKIFQAFTTVSLQDSCLPIFQTSSFLYFLHLNTFQLYRPKLSWEPSVTLLSFSHQRTPRSLYLRRSTFKWSSLKCTKDIVCLFFHMSIDYLLRRCLLRG